MAEPLRMSQVASVLPGYAFPSAQYRVDGVIGLLRGVNVAPNAIDWADRAGWFRTKGDGLDQYELAEGDIVVGMDRPWISTGFRSAVVSSRDLPAMLVQRVARIRSNGLAEQRYLSHLFRLSTFERHLRARHTETTVPHISHRDIEAFEFPFPPLAEQRRIADILDKADAIRRKRKEAIALTEALLRSTFLNLVGPSAEGYQNWPPVRFGDVASSMRTGPFGSDLLHSEFVEEGIAVLGIDNAVWNRFSWSERRFISPGKYEELKRYTVFPGDVLVTIMGTTGRSAVVPADIPPAITTKHLATLTLNPKLATPEFVAQAVHTHPEVLDQIQRANRGAIMNGLNLTLIRSLVVRLPPKERQLHFTRAVTAIRATQATQIEAMSASERLFASLVQRAFAGELT